MHFFLFYYISIISRCIFFLLKCENDHMTNLITVYNFLKEGSGEGGADLLSLVATNRTQGNHRIVEYQVGRDLRDHLIQPFLAKAWSKIRCPSPLSSQILKVPHVGESAWGDSQGTALGR